MLTSPKVSGLSCNDCRQFIVDDGWNYVWRGTVRSPRPRGSATPCWKCPKIPSGDPPQPSSAQDLTASHMQTWRHYQECRAIGCFPDDAIVRRNASWIRQVEDQVQASRNEQKLDLLIHLAAGRR